ncbi:ABC transporter permease [Paenibacillus sp. N1-5-1-14]|uniref:ABC transporter permease n=1 Tax=Paenibacillus radicibacter TaxID=2972488 RepID=UPI0021593904|nr:ABC transporter permease [Paenibacillus radicibacter]MCR8644533.1 ABC transporter permease [Paenibacillus radicibacter]
MVKYALRRILNAIPILLGITIISFAIIHLAPGSPLSQYIEDPTITALDKENMIKAYGLDKPLPTQYWEWLTGMLQGDFGISYMKNEPVLKIVIDRLPTTLLLTVTSFIISMLIAIPLGIICALKENSKFDRIVSGISFTGISVPGFWLALILLMVFGVKLGWLPTGGLQSISGSTGFWDRVHHMIMPISVMVFAEVAIWLRYIRSSMLEVIHQDYMRTAKSKGLLPGRILGIHGMRNALVPLATLLGLAVPGFVAGSLILENIFSIPGMGALFRDAAFQRDYPVIFAITTLGAVLTVAGNIFADISYAFLDPRVSLSKQEVKG